MSGLCCNPNRHELFASFEFSLRNIWIKPHSEFTELHQYELKQTWEGHPHPYLFFNADRACFSFFGCNLRSSDPLARGMDVPFDLVDLSRGQGQVLVSGIANFALYQALWLQGVRDLERSFESKSETEKLVTLCRVLGVDENIQNPDPNYVITTDCALKILAIEMRFRCGIPVVIMGETGCGKTKLIQFLCALKRAHLAQPDDIKNLVIVQLHGGVDAKKIRCELAKAITLARYNRRNYDIDTCLFFDEANTTGAIWQIKEIMCDNTVEGKRLSLVNLNIIAAVNPYRRHSDEMIQKLESAGLGYHVQDSDRLETFGDVPLRQLVYRVQPLPPSMIPLVWDFGSLSPQVQRIYIQQMVHKMMSQSNVDCGLLSPNGVEASIVKIISATQEYMMKNKSEASFVSLRDVERVLTVMQWFYDHHDPLFDEMNEILQTEDEDEVVDDITRSLVLALCVCYRASLQTGREDFDRVISAEFDRAISQNLVLPNGVETFQNEISACQDVFLNHVALEENVAKNEALKENVFMMVICIELRIPLFLVGKPGSSKSLAKMIVDAAMRGQSSTEDTLFAELKQARLISFQCSPLATAEGVEAVFRQCAREQKDLPLDKHVSVAVFDEVGLAEDSPKLPLKALHGLLEQGCLIDQKDEKEKLEKNDYHKVSFIGISNWALDPAKMNRGIFVSRVLPTKKELMKTARRICCEGKSDNYDFVKILLDPITSAYMKVYKKQKDDYEFYGLRDFYSLVKMVYDVAAKHRRRPNLDEVMHVVRRNFSGQKEGAYCQTEFKRRLLSTFSEDQESLPAKVSELIEDNLSGEPNKNRDNRFLLILTENYAVMRTLHQVEHLKDALLIFGSSFPMDLEYTQVCRNINKIKICMDTGRTVILLNLESLYESLYDLLNQSFTYYSKERYVEMGLGSHRLKCHVHQEFRVVVIAEAEEVRRCFPAALINRLEKHYVSMKTDLNRNQLSLTATLQKWAEEFACQGSTIRTFTPADVFVGFHADIAAAVISDVWRLELKVDEIMDEAKRRLLQCATPESVVRLKESSGQLLAEARWCWEVYFEQQHHSDIGSFLEFWFSKNVSAQKMLQLTTHATQLLLEDDAIALGARFGIPEHAVHILTVQNYATEQHFGRDARRIFEKGKETEQLLFIQFMAAEHHSKLVACVRYKMEEYLKEYGKSTVRVILLICLQRLPLSLHDFMQQWLKDGTDTVTQVTAHHRLSTEEDTTALWQSVGFSPENVHIVIDRERHFEMALEKAMTRGEEVRQLVVIQFLAGERKQPSRSAADCRSRILRHLNSYENKTDVRVLLLISLPRISSFPGDNWDSFHLDDLGGKEGDLLDIGHLQDQQISDVLLDSRLINGKLLIREKCIHEAGSFIEDNTERKLDRIRLLLDLLDKNERFSSLFFAHVVMLVKEMEAQMIDRTSWVVKEALNVRRVLENQTFRQALRKKIEDFVTPFVALILCYIDDDPSDTAEEWILQLWQELFADKVFLKDLTYEREMSTFGKGGSRENQKSFGLGSVARGYQLEFPFSWVLKERIDDLLAAVHSTLGFDQNEQVVIQYQDSSWGQILFRVVKQEWMVEGLKRYLHDFVCLTYATKSVSETQHFCEWISRTMEKIRERGCGGGSEISVWPIFVHLANNIISEDILNFQKLAAASPDLPEEVFRDDDMKSRMHFELDVCAASKVVDSLHREITEKKLDVQHDDISKPREKIVRDRRRKWMKKFKLISPCMNQILMKARTADTENDTGRMKHRQKHLDAVSKQWDILTVCYLFLHHVTRVPHSYNVNALRQLLAGHSNMKSVRFIDGLENRLIVWNSLLFRRCFNNKGKPVCVACKAVVKRPELLPCMHVVHKKCLTFRICPDEKCNTPIPDNFETRAEEQLKLKTEEYLTCRSAMTNFFLDLVSSFMFSAEEPPPPKVVEKLLSFVSLRGEDECVKTANFSPFPDEESVDSSPVVRSFLLQQILKYEVPDVTEQIQAYLNDAFQHMQEENSSSAVDFGMMCVACIEDSLHSKFVSVPEEQRMDYLVRKTTGIFPLTRTEGIPNIQAVGGLRFLIGKFVDCIANNTRGRFREQSGYFVERMKQCVEKSDRKVLLYLIRYFCRQYGFEAYKTASNTADFTWLKPVEFQTKDESVPDSFLIYGDRYKGVRDSVINWFVSSDAESFVAKLQETLESDISNEMDEVNVCLSVVSAMSILRRTIDQAERLIDLVETVTSNDQLKTMARGGVDLLNELSRISGSQSVAQLVVHAGVVLSARLDSNRQSVQRFLSALFSQPAGLKDSYFPTMPEDITAACTEQLRAQNKTTTLNYCENGHPYFIGDCGQPVQGGRCGDCGAQIGGQNQYNTPVPGNTYVANYVDQTKCGYCLQGTEDVISNTRELNITETVVVRAVIDVTLLAASVLRPQEVQQLLSNVNNAADFFWRHLNRDLGQLERLVNMNRDDCLYLVHAIFRGLVGENGSGAALNDVLLSRRDGRRQWESTFVESFVRPLLSETANVLDAVHRSVASDQGKNLLWRVVYELEEEAMERDSFSCLWRYRQPNTPQSLLRSAETQIQNLDEQNSGRKLTFLKEFLKRLPDLTALRYLGSVLELHRILFNHFKGSFDVSDKKTTIAECLSGLPEILRHKLEPLIQDFFSAVHTLRTKIETFPVVLPVRGNTVQQFMLGSNRLPDTKNIMQNPVLSLLPIICDEGLCSCVLVMVLVKIHNDFLDNTFQYISQGAQLTEMNLEEAGSLGFDFDKEVLPLFFMHRSFAFTVNTRSTEIKFDLEGLERSLIEVVSPQPARLVPKIRLFRTHRDILADSRKNLRSQAVQRDLTNQQMQEIMNHLGDNIARVKRCLDTTELLLRYASSVPNLSENFSLHSFLGDKLAIGDADKVFEMFGIGHLTSLWEVLMFFHSFLLMTQDNEDLFSELNTGSQVSLSSQYAMQMDQMLSGHDLLLFLTKLTAFIVLRLPLFTGEEYAGALSHGLNDYFLEFVQDEDVRFLELPDSVCLKHTVSVWRISAEKFRYAQEL